MRLTLHFDEPCSQLFAADFEALSTVPRSPVKVRVFMNGTLAPYGELRLEVGKGRKTMKEAVAKE